MDQDHAQTETRPQLSVVMPVHNADRFLDSSIGSVLGSGLADLELICVDDGSTDQSLAILQRHAARDPRMRVIGQPQQGAGVARNVGIRAARGTYVHLLDADDRVEPQAYEEWVRLAAHYDADVVECLYVCVDELTQAETLPEYQYETSARYPQLTNVWESPRPLIYGHVVPWNKIYRRQMLEDAGILFDDLPCAEDRPFYYDVIYHARRFVRTRDHWIVHRTGIPTSLDGSDVRFEHYDVEFRTFEHIWKLAADAPEEHRRMLLDSCIGDSAFYYRRAMGTPWEPQVREQLLEYWRDWVPLLGEDAYTAEWLDTFVGAITEDLDPTWRDILRHMSRAHAEENRYQRRLAKLMRTAMTLAADASRPLRKLVSKVRR